MTTPSAIIFGCEGLSLTAGEKALFARVNPWGFILFKRNIDTPEQVAALTAEMRAAVGRRDAPVLVDQEGGRVQRLGPPHWRAYPNGATYGKLWALSPDRAREAAFAGARLMADDLGKLGITVDCLPVLDVPVEGAHDVIGNRAYHREPTAVASIGRAASLGLMAGGVLPVIKHMPGHGRGMADSHHNLPQVDVGRAELEAHDFAPFRRMRDMPLAMTAHIVFSAIDPDRPATQSPVVVNEIIRGYIGFDGLLMSDDLSMKALGGDFSSRSAAILDAGCDMVLHCNGVMAEMEAAAAGARPMTAVAQRRAKAALRGISGQLPAFDRGQTEARFDELLALVA
ncbi:MAG: beta-N-acetylhexosaminidase [Proteobacteria bacterium]|nr:beta-N-acetylhexosaminidase [Pseudomonadota bacterium]